MNFVIKMYKVEITGTLTENLSSQKGFFWSEETLL